MELARNDLGLKNPHPSPHALKHDFYNKIGHFRTKCIAANSTLFDHFVVARTSPNRPWRTVNLFQLERCWIGSSMKLAKDNDGHGSDSCCPDKRHR